MTIVSNCPHCKTPIVAPNEKDEAKDPNFEPLTFYCPKCGAVMPVMPPADKVGEQ